MNVAGEFTVNAPRDVVFRTLSEAGSFADLVDGVHDLKEINPQRYQALFGTKVAYLNFKFNVMYRRWRGNSGALANRSCAPRQKTWKSNSPPGLVPYLRRRYELI